MRSIISQNNEMIVEKTNIFLLYFRWNNTQRGKMTMKNLIIHIRGNKNIFKTFQ